jgi:hypothetical protein
VSRFTERQAAAWPEAIAEAQRYVPTSTIPSDITSPYWIITWDDEVRPGRGQRFTGVWTDGEYLVCVWMDVYGYPAVSVAALDWLHSSSDDECRCEPCAAERGDLT